MATPKALIDSVISDVDGIDPTDVDNALLRAKYLRALQQIHNFVWNVREWEWTYKESAALSMTAGTNYVALPIDFGSIGQQGSLFDENRRIRLYPKAKYVIERMRRETSGSNSPIFAVWEGKIQIPYVVASTTPFRLFHRLRPPVLADGIVEMSIPDRWTDVVLYPGLVWKSMTKKQDDRQTWAQQFQAGLSQMASDENPSLHENVRMPLAIRGGW